MHSTFTYAGVTNNLYKGAAGEGLPRHEHTYPHATVCLVGSIKVTKEHKQAVLTSDSQPVVLLPNEWHEIEALEDGTVFMNIFESKHVGLP